MWSFCESAERDRARLEAPPRRVADEGAVGLQRLEQAVEVGLGLLGYDVEVLSGRGGAMQHTDDHRRDLSPAQDPKEALEVNG